jgi:energy-coupling factor transport system permease protein
VKPHAVAWLVWALAAAATVELAPSPVYVALVIVAAAVVVERHALDSPLARAFPILIAAGVAFAVLRIVLTAATTHHVGHVLFTTPHVTLPRLLGGFTVGGSVELPVILQSAAEGFTIVGVMAAFGAFNAVVSHYELVQAAPRAFYEPGLVVTVALAFVPSTVTAVAAVREADRARTGNQPARRGRLLRMVVPILETGMERAVNLAESMDARGFARAQPAPADQLSGWCVLATLLALGGAFVALVGRSRPVALLLGIVGVVTLTVAVVAGSRGVGRTRYRLRRLGPDDWRLALVAVIAPVAVAALALAGDHTLTWSATPLHLPRFHPLAGLAVLLLAAPAARRATR